MNIRVRDAKREVASSEEGYRASADELADYDYSKEKMGYARTIGWTDCGCNAGWKSGIALDPFMGSGRVAVVASSLGRDWLGIELSQDYIALAEHSFREEVKQPLLPVTDLR